ncbi:MAG: hypothetical protein IKJ45_18000 [Kiritimatiellae bacterium]|nr:hypothetical protein [Kiritimatiellia bacterium]
MDEINDHVDRLVDYRNGFEVHREIGMTPQEAWGKAIAEGRSKLRWFHKTGGGNLSGRSGRERLSDLVVALLSTDVFARRNVPTGRRFGCVAILMVRCQLC